MSSEQEVVTPASPDTEPEARSHSVLVEIPLAVYRFLHSKNTGLVIILVMAFLALLGTLIPQMPAGVRADAISRAEWLEEARSRFGALTDVVAALGMFNIYSSIWFTAASVLLTLSIIACTTHRLPLLWNKARNPHVRVSEGFFSHAQALGKVSVDGGEDTAYDAVVNALTKRRYRVLNDEGNPVRSLYADRFRWGPFGTAAAHTAFVVIIIGMLVSSLWGTERYIPATVGTTHELVPGSGITLEVLSFTDTYNLDGTASDYVSHVILRDGDAVKETDIRVNTPLTWQGIRVHQTSYGPALAISVSDSTGRLISDAGAPLNWTSEDGVYSVGRIDLPEQDLIAVVSVPASGNTSGALAPGEMFLELYSTDGDPLLSTPPVLGPGESFTYEGVVFEFERETKYTGLTVATDPGAIWIWIGSALLVLGMSVTFGFRHRRIWVRFTPEGDSTLVRVAAVDNLDPIQERHLDVLLNEIGELREFILKRTESEGA